MTPVPFPRRGHTRCRPSSTSCDLDDGSHDPANEDLTNEDPANEDPANEEER